LSARTDKSRSASTDFSAATSNGSVLQAGWAARVIAASGVAAAAGPLVSAAFS